MVGEFPELQGVMGGYYARHDGEPRPSPSPVEDHYRPRFAGDALPRNAVGLAVALADKLETLAGLFGIGQLPTGDKDPFALRRHALGVIRMLVERATCRWRCRSWSRRFPAFGDRHRPGAGRGADFLYDRLVGYLRERATARTRSTPSSRCAPPRWAEVKSGWRRCAPSPRCPRPNPRWRRPTSASATS